MREVIAERQRQVATRRQDDGRRLDRRGPAVDVVRTRRRAGQAARHQIVDAAHGRPELLRSARGGRFADCRAPIVQSRPCQSHGVCRPAAVGLEIVGEHHELGGWRRRWSHLNIVVGGRSRRDADTAHDWRVARCGESDVVGPRGEEHVVRAEPAATGVCFAMRKRDIQEFDFGCQRRASDASVTWPWTQIGRSSTQRIPGQTIAASSSALS